MSLKDLVRDLLGLARREAQTVLNAQKQPVCDAVDRAVARLRQQVGNYASGDTVRRYLRSEAGRVLSPVKMSDSARSLVAGLISGSIDQIDLDPARDYTLDTITAAAERLKAQIRGARL